jgi:hypothetical protein
VQALNTETGVAQPADTDSAGFYSFPALAIGHYRLVFRKDGFSECQETGIVIAVNSLLRVDAVLQVGKVAQQVTVTTSTEQVNTTNAQMGELIGSEHIVLFALVFAPFGTYYGSPLRPEFVTPVLDRGTGNIEGHRFPVPPPPANSSPTHPASEMFLDFRMFLKPTPECTLAARRGRFLNATSSCHYHMS